VKPLKNRKFLLTVFLLAIAAAIPVQLAYSSTLTVTVFTDKPSYLVAEDIIVYGNLTYDGSPVPNWPVALEVQDPTGTPVVTRTPQTDTSGTYNVTFKLPANAELGTYTVYVSSGYKGETATDSATFEVIPIRDVAVTNVASSKTVVGQGCSVNITVIVDNQGEPTETFNVTVQCNETAITLPNAENYTTVTLASGESTTITFTWNTTGFAYGNYTISAYAWPVPDEANTEDNNFTDGLVSVTIIGDVDGNGNVNVLDAIDLSNSFGKSTGQAGFNSDADFDDNGIVNILDAITLANNFGQHYP
jgi:hypothetical protein